MRNAGSEETRLNALYQIRLLDTPAEERFDRITRVVANALDCPMAAISLVDRDRVWRKSVVGMTELEMPRQQALCSQVVLDSQPQVIRDVRADKRFRARVLAQAEPTVRFYAGVPLHGPEGARVGALCVLDYRSREIGTAQMELLKDLAELAERELLVEATLEVQARCVADIRAQQQAEAERRREAERMALAVRAGGVGIFEVDLGSGELLWDARMHELCGIPDEGAPPNLQTLRGRCHPDDLPGLLKLTGGLRRGADSIETEFRVILKRGRVRFIRMLGTVFQSSEGSSRVLIGTCWDVTESRQLQHQLVFQASHDALTGLANRFEFERELRDALSQTAQRGSEHAVCFIDLDRFKLVNDTAGHAAGDALLRELGRTLGQARRSSDVLARLGGDEFGLLLRDCSVDKAEEIAVDLIRRIESLRFRWQRRCYTISASVGIAGLHGPAANIAEVMSQADVACYSAKTAGRGRVSIYRPDHSAAREHHRELLVASTIRQALEERRFCLHAQQIVPLGGSAGAIRPHAELLLRMHGQDGELVLPSDFIPAAERYDLMALLDRWVLTEVLEARGARLAANAEFSISLNISAQSLTDPGFLPFLVDLIDKSALPPNRLCFELTETAAVTHLEAAIQVLRQLRDMGCMVALDDFGSGLSSFNYLKNFPVHFVKIDGSFIRALLDSPADRAIVESIHGLAHKLGVRTVAECVESEELLEAVQAIGIDCAQGFGIHRPEPLSSMLDRVIATSRH
ncbi:MAG: EAL domain-containing protein [Ectothiorhodospiraceae bacterium]|nr:EAL domain-containing protein [Ectothiorhodospiraceae bacterium]